MTTVREKLNGNLTRILVAVITIVLLPTIGYLVAQVRAADKKEISDTVSTVKVHEQRITRLETVVDSNHAELIHQADLAELRDRAQFHNQELILKRLQIPEYLWAPLPDSTDSDTVSNPGGYR